MLIDNIRDYDLTDGVDTSTAAKAISSLMCKDCGRNGDIDIVTGFFTIKDAKVYFVAAEHDNRVSALKKTENQLSKSIGFDMDIQKNAKFLQVKDTLINLCDVPAL